MSCTEDESLKYDSSCGRLAEGGELALQISAVNYFLAEPSRESQD